MKKKNITKKALAILMSFIMIVSSLPVLMVGAIGEGSYDPAPYWGDGSNEAAGNTNFIATLNADGSLSVAFPHANAAATWNTYTAATPTKKSIASYVMTITKLEDDGTRTEIWSENFNLNNADGRVGTFTVDNTEGNKYPNTIYYWPGALTSLDTYEDDASYDISIQAVDSDGWVSDKIHALLTETPYYIINDDFSPNESWVVREMLLFESKGSGDVSVGAQSDNGATSGNDYLETNGLIDCNGQMAGMGYNSTAGYRYWISAVDSGEGYASLSNWSRSHYDFNNAEEVWFYVDFSRVTMDKFAFCLSANEKYYIHYRNGDNGSTNSDYGDLFSTKAIAGKNTGTISEGIYIQNADGLWETSSMTDGYFTNLSGYTGFVRIPVEYFLLQNDQYLTADSTRDDWDSGYYGCDATEAEANETNLENYVNLERIKEGDILTINGVQRGEAAKNTTLTYYKSDDGTVSTEQVTAPAILVNPAGTSVSDAIILYERQECIDTGNITNKNIIIRSPGWTVGELSAFTQNTDTTTGVTTYNITDPCYAIEDMIAAGFHIAGWSEDSVKKSFYIDQVMFCQKDINATFDANGYVTTDSPIQFPQEGAVVNESGTADVGRKMAGFYDRTKEVPKAVAEYILQYFGEIPSLNDANAKELIDDIILKYTECFGVSSTSALSDAEKISQAIEKLNTLGHTEAYNRYKLAEAFVDYVYSEDAETNYNAVIYFENEVEKLPTKEFADHLDVKLQETLKQLMAIYETFNLSHFEMLGKDSEEKFLELYELVMGEEVKTGQSIGAYPFIPFNDFETQINGYNAGYAIGQKSLRYYDDYPTYQDARNQDVNNTKNLVTYATNATVDMSNNSDASGVAIGFAVEGYAPSSSTRLVDTNFSKIDAMITDNGFADSKGVTVELKGDLNNTDVSDGYNIVTVATTYKGQNVNNWSELEGLNLSALSVKTDSSQGTDAQDVERYGGALPNSFVMYVDFTQVNNLAMNIQFILQDPDGNDVVCFLCAGADGEDPNIYLLDENGEWEEQALSQTPLDVSEAGNAAQTGICTIYPSSLNSLQGYKGFIRIPLVNFRTTYSSGGVIGIGSTKYNNFLDNLIDDHTIKQVKVSFWDYSGENIDTEVHIDALGFTYDDACTTRANNQTDCNGELNQENGIHITDMDEFFGVKTVDSSKFEQMVSTIDPYATEAEFKASFDKCIDAYLALSDYQKTIPEVKYCYETLLEAKYRNLYRDYTNEIQKDEWKPLYTATADGTAAENLLTALGAVSETAKEYSTDEETLLDLYGTHKDDYLTALGFTSIEEAQSVIDMYEKGYHRLSMDDRASITDYDFGRLTNAYNAAKRAVLIGGDADVHEGVEKDGIIANVETFKNNITRIYGLSSHTDDDADRIPDTEDSDNELRTVKYAGTTTDADGNTVNALGYYTDMYADISVFGKKLLSDDTDVAAAYMNMYDAAEAIHDNSTAITPMAGAAVEGGIITYERRLENAYTDVSAKITARTVLDIPTLNEIEYCLGQYEAFLRRYALVDELNYDYVQLALLLPTADLGKADGEQVVLTNSDEHPLYLDTADANLTYVAARLNRTVSVYLVTDYKWTQTGGTAYNFGYFNVNGSTGTDGTVTYTKLGDYANGVTSAFAPEISVDEAKAKKVPTGNQYEGTVTLMAFDSAMITDGVDMATLEPVSTVEIPVMFVSTNGSDPIYYTVSIPADLAVDWDDTANKSVSYEIENASLNGGTLTVDVADNTGNFNTATNIGKLMNGDNAIEYTAYNFKETVFTTNISSATKPTDEPEVKISQEDWDAAALGEYRTTLTYTVIYDDGT